MDENVIKRIMPHSLEAEQSVIGSMFIDAEAIAAATEQISGDDFYNRQYGIVFDTIVELNNEGKPIDFVTLQDRLRAKEDVPPEVIVETAIREQVTLVGLSALMTTTVVSMEETIRQLREKKPDCRVMVGGAVMTQEYADAIGADFYGKDAMASVRYADSLFA